MKMFFDYPILKVFFTFENVRDSNGFIFGYTTYSFEIWHNYTYYSVASDHKILSLNPLSARAFFGFFFSKNIENLTL